MTTKSGDLSDNVTGGDIRLKGTIVGLHGTLRGVDSIPPVAMRYVHTVEHQEQNTCETLAVTKRAGGVTRRAGGEIPPGLCVVKMPCTKYVEEDKTHCPPHVSKLQQGHCDRCSLISTRAIFNYSYYNTRRSLNSLLYLNLIRTSV